ncbi:MAG: hypothetical protein EBT87_01615 [Alphaproteobacteria bacterium]|jgi:hypothetical protein|nr:hypothetical protein [Alphaproteobacteria bacterium]
MITEIGALMHKGAGLELMNELHGDKDILGIFVEAGRTEDLFAYREFGSASENDIVTILVENRHATKIFDLICSKIGLDKPQSGMVFQMPLHK